MLSNAIPFNHIRAGREKKCYYLHYTDEKNVAEDIKSLVRGHTVRNQQRRDLNTSAPKLVLFLLFIHMTEICKLPRAFETQVTITNPQQFAFR